MSHRTVSYTYDTLNRLATASSSAGWADSYTYDGFGNLTDKNPTGSAPALHVTVNAGTNQINTGGYYYDANGNLGGPYDVENRLVANAGDTYTYGVDNMRVWKLKPDGTEELQLYGALGERLGTYPIQPNPNGTYLFYVAAGTTVQYFAGRMVGMRDRLESNGTYYPYGEDYGTPYSDTENFATYYRDGTTGLDYAKNRYYSSILARFLTPDPYMANNGGAGDPADPGSWNRYVYAGNDPVNFSDPSGLFLGCPSGDWAACGGGSDPGTGTSSFDPSLWRFVTHFSPSPTTPRSKPLNAYKTARDLKKAGGETDCQALADFADAIAGALGDDPQSVRDFVKAFGVLTPKRPGEEALGVAYNTNPVYFGNNGKPSGFAAQFQDNFGSPQGPNNSDQGHHFAAFFQLGYQAPALTTIAPSVWEAMEGTLVNQGDINLGQAAAYLGAQLRSGTFTPSDIGTQIRSTICAH